MNERGASGWNEIFAANESPTTSKKQIVTLTNDIGNKCKKE
jgi:hypothetical protein